jgi:signal transduction histidine kinase
LITRSFPPARARKKTAAFLLAAMSFAATLWNFACPAAAATSSSPDHGPRRVLMIFSEAKDLPGNIMIEQAFRAELQRLSPGPVEFYAEHMDASHFANKELYRIFRDYLAAKYQGEPLDLLMVFLGRDFKLAEDLPPDVFPKVPAIFVTASEMEVPQALVQSGIAGIVQRYDPAATINLMRQLQPDLEHIVVIGGTSESDARTLGRIEAVSRAAQGIRFEFWTNRPMKELIEPASELPAGTALLLSTVLSDASGQTYYMSQAAQFLSPYASAPIYALGGSAIGSGALGGAAINPANVGRDAAATAARALAGNLPEPRITIRTNITGMVDWRQLQHWGISPRRVPADCVMQNRPKSLWEEHRRTISLILAVLLAQAITIAALLVQRSQRRRAETEIQRQRTELAHASRLSTMGQLASSLAHEINQPLGAILRNAEAAELFLDRDKPDLAELRAIVADIRKDDQRAGGVIDRMRSLLKRQKLDSTQLDVRELLEETLALARPDARLRHFQLTLDAPALIPRVRGDRVQLQQVLLNLILNAMDSMTSSRNGDSTDKIVVTASPDNSGSVEISVSDCGEGISADKLPRIFEPFFTTKPNGMGMGLAISKTIIEAHGGTIRARNNPDHGATFSFTLPVQKAAERPDPIIA